MTVTMTTTTTTTTTSIMTTTDDREGALEAVAESLGRTLVSSSQFHSEATGEGFTTGHEVELENPDGTREAHIVYVESRPTTKDRPGVLRLLDETTGESMAVWLYPGDPRLPALPAAVFPGAATVLLERLGLDATDLAIDVVAYRPGKRAVVRMTTVAGVLYLKVVRPEAAEKIRARHELWLGAGVPVPGVLASASDGIVALDALPGVEAINLVPEIADGVAFLDALDRLVGRIATVPSETDARSSLIGRLDWYVRRLADLAPESSAALAATQARIGGLFSRGGIPPRVTVHGDLHLAQIFVDPQRPTEIVGVLDIDTAGLGDPADDAAALVAHLLVTADHREKRDESQFADSARMLAESSRGRWARPGDTGFAARATAIAATHLLGHALSGSVSVETAVRLAAQLLDLHEHESALTTISHASHSGSGT